MSSAAVVGYLLSESKPAELYAVELCEAECAGGCAVVTRDHNAVLKAGSCAALLFRGFWLVLRVMSQPRRNWQLRLYEMGQKAPTF